VVPRIPDLQISVRAAMAAGIAVALAQLLALPFPIYAMIAAVIVTDLAPAKTRALAVQRLVGTVVGAGVGAIGARWLPANAWTVALAIVVPMLACHAARWPEAARLAGYVSAIVVLDHAGGPWLYAGYRLVETALGIGVAVAVSFVPKLLRAEAPQASTR
jgi:uncharacterized membrane protein YgaE (UPF0421/DUF939 family)